MRNITVSVRDKVPRHSSRAAAAIDAAFDTVTDFAASDRLTRDQVNDRAITDGIGPNSRPRNLHSHRPQPNSLRRRRRIPNL